MSQGLVYPCGMKYEQTFENFVVSATNKIPVIVLKSILTKDGPNRILLYGPSGSGKTHLLQALSRAAESAWPSVSCDSFTGYTLVEEYVCSIQENRAKEFSDQLHSLDLLLVDDLSLLAFKSETSRFFESLAADTDGPRIVATSPINLDSASGFTTKLVHEISQGVTVQLTEADEETARAILWEHTSRAGLNLTREAVATIAETVGTNGHRLVGAVETLRAHVMQQEAEIEPDLVSRILTVDI